jgi:hypothetical protein
MAVALPLAETRAFSDRIWNVGVESVSPSE